MLGTLTVQPPDTILALMQAFQADPRADKIDLGVGVYKNAAGATPVMRAVKAAEQQLWSQEATKSYVALAGGAGFGDAMRNLVLGDAVQSDQVAIIATPGGTGAVRFAFELARIANPDLRVFTSDPTWPNHISILQHMGINPRPYRYFDAHSRGVDFEGMISDLKTARAGDLVLLHGCCHNPTGANLNLTEWQGIAELLNTTGAVPMIDIAYQGFGDGLDTDAAGTRLIAAQCPQTLIATSCSKNFSIYRERAGALMTVTQDTALTAVAQDNLNALNRLSYSFPPDHGARLVAMVLQDPALRADWQAELDDMRNTMLNLRTSLAQELQRLSGSDRFGFLAQHRGMFSQLGASPDQVETLRADHGIYMLGDSRMNIAGLTADTVPILAKAIIDVGI